MFTGIIEEVGKISGIKRGAKSCRLTFKAHKVLEDVKIGDSIAANGVCLTVTSFDTDGYTADVMHETLSKSALGALKPGDPVNLERAMPANGRFGGHMVSGHIDGTGTVRRIVRDDNAVRYTIGAEAALLRYIVKKGSVALDGISLTVADTSRGSFEVSVIPHTAAQTTLAARKIGDAVNIECDVIGKYVERFVKGDGITLDFLAQNGF